MSTPHCWRLCFFFFENIRVRFLCSLFQSFSARLQPPVLINLRAVRYSGHFYITSISKLLLVLLFSFFVLAPAVYRWSFICLLAKECEILTRLHLCLSYHTMLYFYPLLLAYPMKMSRVTRAHSTISITRYICACILSSDFISSQRIYMSNVFIFIFFLYWSVNYVWAFYI